MRQINVRLLRRVAKHISEEPLRLDMERIVRRGDDIKGTPPPCGTTACIAGWAILLAKKKDISGYSDNHFPIIAGRPWDVTDARYLIGGMTTYLFFVGSWPRNFSEAYRKALTPRERADVAVARIEHFIKTKGAE